MKETIGLFINNELELEKVMFYYNCQTLEELEKILYDDYNVCLIYDIFDRVKNNKHVVDNIFNF